MLTNEALSWAIENRVDIIVLASWFSEDFENVKNTLANARGQGIITLAGAGNHGPGHPITFPARLSDSVFCVAAADASGETVPTSNRSSGIEKYSAFEDFVLGAYRDSRDGRKTFGVPQHNTKVRLPGTQSLGLAVAAGIAALLLDYTRTFWDVSDGYAVMRKLFALISKSSASKSYRYLDINSFFNQGENCEELIKAELIKNTEPKGDLLERSRLTDD